MNPMKQINLFKERLMEAGKYEYLENFEANVEKLIDAARMYNFYADQERIRINGNGK